MLYRDVSLCGAEQLVSTLTDLRVDGDTRRGLRGLQLFQVAAGMAIGIPPPRVTVHSHTYP